MCRTLAAAPQTDIMGLDRAESAINLHGQRQADALLVLAPEVAAGFDKLLHLSQLLAKPVCVIVRADEELIAGERLSR